MFYRLARCGQDQDKKQRNVKDEVNRPGHIFLLDRTLACRDYRAEISPWIAPVAIVLEIYRLPYLHLVARLSFKIPLALSSGAI
jgi:hypothetical protein